MTDKKTKSSDSKYGERSAKISWQDTDKRRAEFMIQLKHDGITITKFLRAVLTGYLSRDSSIVNFIERYKIESGSQSNRKAKISASLEKKGEVNKRKFGIGLDDSEIENIFDVLEKELPDL